MSALRASALVVFLSMLSKILGAVRQAVFAHEFGAGREIDIYVAAFRVPDLIFNLLILGTLSVAFIPVFVEYLERDRKEAFAIASTIFNFTFLVMAGVSALGFFLSPLLVKLTVPGFDEAAKAQTLELTRVLMLSPLLFSLSSVLGSILHSHRKFLFTGLAPLLYNASIIGGAFFLYPRFGLIGLAYGVVAGAVFHLLVQLPTAARLGLRIFQNPNLSLPGVRKIGKLFLPRIFGMDLGQISLYAASIIASFQASGSLAVFYFAYDLETVPLGVFAVSFAIASFPTMSSYFVKKNMAAFRDFFSQVMVQILFLMIPISVLVMLLRAQIVRLILGAGQDTAFSFADTKHTASALGIFAVSLFAQSLVPILARAFYATQNTIVPVMSGAAGAFVNIALAVTFARIWPGPEGLALAFGIAVTLHMLIMFALLRHRLEGLPDDFLLVRVTKIVIAAIFMGIGCYLTLYAVAPLVDMQTYFGVLVQAITALAAGITVYLLAGLAVGLPETKGLLIITRTWFSKFTKPLTSAIVDTFTDLR